jgi:hypothetical protein
VGLSSRRSSLDVYSPLELVFFGLVLVTAGGLGYAALSPVLMPLSAFLLILGVMIFLQSSRGFRVPDDLRFVVLLGIACGVLLLVDWWPTQLFFARTASDILSLLGVSPLVLLNPHFGGLQVLLFVPAAGTGSLVGGEIDNACAGLPVLVPALLLLWPSKAATASVPNRAKVSLFAVSLIMIGDTARIVLELWLPAVGVAPFVLVHYPGAFVLGLTGLCAIALAGQRWNVTPVPRSWRTGPNEVDASKSDPRRF